MTTSIFILIVFISASFAGGKELQENKLYASNQYFSNKTPTEYFARSIKKFDQFYLINGKITEASLKSVSENHFVIETKSGKIITPEKGYFNKVISKNGKVVFSRPDLKKSVGLLEGTLNQPAPKQKKAGQIDLQAGSHSRSLEILPFVRFGLMAASLGAGVYSFMSYQKGDEIYTEDYQNSTTNSSARTYERKVRSYDEKANIAMSVSGGLLIAGLISFAF